MIRSVVQEHAICMFVLKFQALCTESVCIILRFIISRPLIRFNLYHLASRARAQCEGTALINAAVNGHADCVRLLLDAGADKEAKTIVRGRVRSASG